MEAHRALPVGDASQVSEARRAATALAVQLGFDAADAGRVGLVVTEAGSNILKHATRGTLLLRSVRELCDQPGIELLALDRGPGMADLEACRRDGYSTAGSPGTGLGAMARMSSSLDVYSAPGSGTALLIRVLPRGAQPLRDASPVRIGAVRTAAPGETVCGDDWDLALAGGRAPLMLADGLGHGEQAALAAREAVRCFRANLTLPPEGILDAVHGALVPTRGAAVSIAVLDVEHDQVHYAGMGNVCGLIAGPAGSRSMVGQNGTVGGEFRRARATSYPWAPAAVVILYSDGLGSQLGVQRYPGLLARDPALVAGVLYRDFLRGRDDATIVVARRAEAAP